MVNPVKIISAAKKLKNARAVKDAKTIASSPHLKQTPDMTIKQAKVMKQGTKQLAAATKKISNRSNRSKQDNLTVGEFNSFLTRMGMDKPTTFPKSGKMEALDTPSIGGKINAPENMTLRQVNRGSYLEEQQKAKAYAAAYRQAKRDVKTMTNAMQSTKTRVTKKVAKGTAAAGAVGGSYAALQSRRGK